MQPILTSARGQVPFGLSGASPLAKAMLVLLGTGVLAASSWIAVPMFPVPVTMQSFAVVLIGALCGWRLGLATVLAWLAEAALGLPVLANGSGGPLVFLGPTAGYLLAFPLMAAMVGYAVERGITGNSLVRLGGVMLLAQALCLVVGGAWLMAMVGPARGLALGVTPFLLGGALKAGLAMATVRLATRLTRPKTNG